MSPPLPVVAAWPAAPLEPPRYRRWRYTLVGDAPTASLVGVPLEENLDVSGECCLRLAEVDLDDPAAILAFANDVGTAGFGGGPEEQTVAEFAVGAAAIRDAVAAWRLLSDDPDLNGAGWQLPRLADVPEGELPEAAAEYLNDVLDGGLSAFTPTVSVRIGAAAGVPVFDLSLYDVCCLELFNHVAGGADFRVCANEACERVFARDERARRRGVRYCSRSCARAQAQREFRRRKVAAQQDD